jgi:hypothetical protein
MIAKRFADALRRQDWAMITIEFLLVVVGVLLAFQINEWASERANASGRQRSTERLLEEAELTVAYNRQAVGYQQAILRGLGFAIARIERADWQKADEERIVDGLAKARSMVALSPPSSVYEDVVSSGELNKIGDVALRAAISRYRATLSFEERMRQQLQAPLAAYERIPAFRYQTDPEGKARIRLAVDFPSLARDREAQQMLALTAENHRILLMLRTRALRDSERMCVALGSAVARPCNRNLPPPKFD